MNYCLDLFCDFTTAAVFTTRRETLEDAELTKNKIYTAGQARSGIPGCISVNTQQL